jgi:hypothetical protein
MEQSAMTIRIDRRPVINDFMTHPQAADGGQLNGNDLRTAMKIVYEHMHRIRPTDRDTLLRALDTLECVFRRSRPLIPTGSRPLFRRDVGQHSNPKPATIPI